MSKVTIQNEVTRVFKADNSADATAVYDIEAVCTIHMGMLTLISDGVAKKREGDAHNGSCRFNFNIGSNQAIYNYLGMDSIDERNAVMQAISDWVDELKHTAFGQSDEEV